MIIIVITSTVFFSDTMTAAANDDDCSIPRHVSCVKMLFSNLLYVQFSGVQD